MERLEFRKGNRVFDILSTPSLYGLSERMAIRKTSHKYMFIDYQISQFFINDNKINYLLVHISTN